MLSSRFLALTLVAISSVACASVLGLDEFTDDPGANTPAGGGGTATIGGAGGAGATAGGGAGAMGGAGATGGTGGLGGMGGTGGAFSCIPGEVVACAYTGPAGTEGVGVCVAATQTCNEDGTAFDPCEGEVTPAAMEDCTNLLDDDCNGDPNDGCACTPLQVEPCYDGPAGTAGVGICATGTHVCNASGMGFGPCTGQTLPEAESCSTAADENCNGVEPSVDLGAGCVCIPGSTSTCYTGPAGTLGVGICAAGVEVCAASGLGYGACMGQVVPMAESCSVAADENCDGGACSVTSWAAGYGDSNSQTGYSIAFDPAGNAYITGSFAGTIVFGSTILTAQLTDTYLAKISPAGQPLWAKQIGTTSNDEPFGVAADASKVVLAGRTGTATSIGGTPVDGVYVLTFDFAGNQLWAKDCGGGNLSLVDVMRFGDVAIDPLGNVVLAISSSESNNCGQNLVAIGNTDVFISKLSPAGAHVWSERFGLAPSGNVHVADVALASNGDVWLTGKLASNVNFGGGALTLQGSSDAYLVKLAAANGSHLFSQRYGDAANQQGAGIAVDPNGGPVMVGRVEGSMSFGGGVSATSAGLQDAFIARFSSAGAATWAKALGESGANQAGYDVKVSPGGNVMMTGTTRNAVNFGGGAQSAQSTDIFVVRFDTAGNYVWSRVHGGAAIDEPRHIALDGNVHFGVTGYYTSDPINFGTGNIPFVGTTLGGGDVFAFRGGQ